MISSVDLLGGSYNDTIEMHRLQILLVCVMYAHIYIYVSIYVNCDTSIKLGSW